MEILYSAVVKIATPELLTYYTPLTNNQRIVIKVINDSQIIISDNISFENELYKLNCRNKIVKDKIMIFYEKPSIINSNISKFDIQLKNNKILLHMYVDGHNDNPIEIKGEEI